jgi:NAD(P)-dependent dehydrogenase (short-subunit alcohol dehydrogenase family)
LGNLLKNKVAVITGSGRGIGRAHALAFAAEGARVVVNDIGVEQDGTGGSRGPANAVVKQIRDLGGEAVANYDSVAGFQAAGSIIQTAVNTFGRVDILINNAGFNLPTPFQEMAEAEWDAIVDVHLKGAFNTCRHAVPIMMRQGFGRIINTAARQWCSPEGHSVYGAAKAGLVGLTWGLANDLFDHGITVNAYAPTVRTDPELVTPMVLYLSSDLASNVTGQVFLVEPGKIGLYSHPVEVRSIYRNYNREGPWSIEELQDILPSTVLSAAH